MNLANCYGLIKAHFPAYISWQQYEANVARLKVNRAHFESPGAVRHGPALLAGLVVGAKCGHRMSVNYSAHAERHRYQCDNLATNYGGKRCQQSAGQALNRFVTELVLASLEPAALELSLAAADPLEQERAALVKHWQLRLERAAFEADRAQRHYQLLEPENRLVAPQLAQEWEEKLSVCEQLEHEHHRFLTEQASPLTEDKQKIRHLAKDIPA